MIVDPIGGLRAALENGVLVIRVPVRFEVRSYSLSPAELGLTQTEEKVYGLLVDSPLTNKEIASELGSTERVIKFHVSSILHKSRCQSRAELRYKAKG